MPNLRNKIRAVRNNVISVSDKSHCSLALVLFIYLFISNFFLLKIAGTGRGGGAGKCNYVPMFAKFSSSSIPEKDKMIIKITF